MCIREAVLTAVLTSKVGGFVWFRESAVLSQFVKWRFYLIIEIVVSNECMIAGQSVFLGPEIHLFGQNCTLDSHQFDSV